MTEQEKIIKVIKHFLQNREDWDLNELTYEISEETKLLQNPIIKGTLSLEECGIIWGDDDVICVLEEFVDRYTEIFIEKICDIMDSFSNEDLDDYYDEFFEESE